MAVSEWLFWQVGGLGPMAGQANHFRIYAAEKIPYAIDRYTDEVNRLFGVMNRRLADHEYLAGPYSIADMACVGWTRGWKRYGQEISDFPHLARWLDAVLARPAVQRGLALDIPGRKQHDLATDEEARKDPVRPARAVAVIGSTEPGRRSGPMQARHRAPGAESLAKGGSVGHMSLRALRNAGDVAERLKAAVC